MPPAFSTPSEHRVLPIEKRRHIKDPVWQSILVLSWEKRLIQHPVFNRLSSIIQNSSGFRVYPGLKVTRFIHSLGVMHVATKIFGNLLSEPGVDRTDANLKRALFGQQSQLVYDEAIEQFNAESEKLAHFFAHDETSLIHRTITRDINLSFANGDNCQSNTSVHLAALRIAALLHDIGHLPYSHVAEFALKAAGRRVRILPEGENEQETLFRDCLDSMAPTQGSHAIHEKLGQRLMFFLSRDMSSRREPTLTKLIDSAARILHSDDLPISRSILSGTVDADRIDFVNRDTFFSGLLRSSVDYDRLFSSFALHKIRKEDSDAKPFSDSGYDFVAAPGFRAISEVKKLLFERFQDYKYIVCHHRVHFYDEVVERCIIELLATGRLSDLVDRLVGIAKELKSAGVVETILHPENLLGLLTAFDDSWLEMEIRQAFLQILSQKTNRESHLEELLVSYVSERSSFRSAFKSDEEFWGYATNTSTEFARIYGNGKELREMTVKVNLRKHEWENALETKEKTGPVVIGDVSRKVSIGISGPQAAAMLGLDELSNFLLAEVINTMPFNFWFKSVTEEEFEDKRAQIFEFLRKELLPQSELATGVPALRQKKPFDIVQ